MKNSKLNISKEKIEEFCQRYHIRRLLLFGSVLRDDFKENSDVDVLVEFESGHIPGLIRFAGMEIELSKILGRKADLNTSGFLSHHFRDEVLSNTEELYAQT
jgi:hypothetical protein